MSHGYTTTSWVQKNLPQLDARGREETERVIDQAIKETRVQRFWTVLLVILFPAVLSNAFHTEILALLGGTTSRPVLLFFSVVVSAFVAAELSKTILHRRIEKLAIGNF